MAEEWSPRCPPTMFGTRVTWRAALSSTNPSTALRSVCRAVTSALPVVDQIRSQDLPHQAFNPQARLRRETGVRPRCADRRPRGGGITRMLRRNFSGDAPRFSRERLPLARRPSPRARCKIKQFEKHSKSRYDAWYLDIFTLSTLP